MTPNLVNGLPKGPTVSLGDARLRAGLSRRAAARAIGVSPDSLRRYETGERRVPDPVLESLERLYGRPNPEDAVRRTVGGGGKTKAELLEEVEEASHRRALVKMLEEGTLFCAPVARTDARGRIYVRMGVFAASEPSGLDRTAPPLRGGRELASARQAVGLSTADMAIRVGVAPSTYRGWESKAPPRGRLGQLSAALGAPPTPEQLRETRLAAGWTLKELAERIGVSFPTVAAWEGRRRPIPSGRRPSLLAACAEMRREQGTPLRRRRDRIVRLVEADPGITVAAVRHRFRVTTRRRHVFDRETDRALRLALAEGTLIRQNEIRFDRLDRPKAQPRLYTPASAPGPPPTSPRLTGDDLGALRLRRGFTQQELGHRIGLSGAWVSRQEHRHERAISTHWTPLVLGVLESEPDLDARLRGDVLDAVREEPGLSRQRLAHRLGWGSAVQRARESLLASGDLTYGDAWDAIGRRFSGLYVRGAQQTSHALALQPTELRPRRLEFRLTASQLGLPDRRTR